MSKLVRIGIIGCGFIANYHAIGYRPHREAKIVAVADQREEAAKDFASRYGIDDWYTDYRKLLERADIDAVSVCTPHVSHAEITIAAAKAGKHVLCEKPMAMTIEEADQMIEACNKAGVVLQIGYISRSIPAFSNAKQLIDDGAIGKVTLIHTVRWGALPWSEWYYDPKGGGIFTDRFCYGADFARWYAGAEIDTISIAGEVLYHYQHRTKFGHDFIDNLKAIARMKNGVLVSMDDTYSVNVGGYYERLEIAGTEGIIIADPSSSGTVFLNSANGSKVSSPFEGLVYGKNWSHPGDVYREAQERQEKHFLKCILDGVEPICTGVDGRAAVEAVIGALKSHREGTPVKFPL